MTNADGQREISAVLITHGVETTALGGPTVRVPRTVETLRSVGINASYLTEAAGGPPDIAHVFNLWPSESCIQALDRAKQAGSRTVLSPIFLNLSNTDVYGSEIIKLLAGSSDGSVDHALMQIARRIEAEPNLPIREPFRGYHHKVRSAVQMADQVILLSEYERECLSFIGARPRSSTLVPNPVDAQAFTHVDDFAFVDKFGIKDYVLCVGRIEPRKNQLMLAYAARSLDLPLVFIGHDGKPNYTKMIQDIAGPKTLFLNRIDPSDPMLRSAFSNAAVFCLPSWAEGAPLAALEAAATGVPLVLSDRSSEQEYLGQRSLYVNPADIDGLKEALFQSVATKRPTASRKRINDFMEKTYNWGTYTRKTAEAYNVAMNADPLEADRNNDPIYFDLTTSYHFSGNPTGIARVEQRAFEALVREFGERVVPVTWNSQSRNFVIVPVSHPFQGATIKDVHRLELSGQFKTFTQAPSAEESKFVILGGAWIRNRDYLDCLIRLKRDSGIGISVLVHDLIQMKLSYLYPKGTGAEFSENAKRLVRLADNFLCYSQATRQDLTQFLIEQDCASKTISMFKLGDMTDRLQGTSQVEDTFLQWQFRNRNFCLFVSSIDPRKNHILLLNVWRKLVTDRGEEAPHLVLVGRPMWKSEDILAVATEDPMLAKFVHILSDVNDADLHWFYENTLFTLYPSLYEGWGLPVAESLAYGKICIASNSTSTAEVSPELTDLLDPYDFKSWLDRIWYYLENPEARAAKEAQIRTSYKPHSWSVSVRQLVEAIEVLPVVEDGFGVDLSKMIAPVKVSTSSVLPSIAAAQVTAAPTMSENLQIALAQTLIPERLPKTRRLFRLLRALNVDWLLLKVQRKMTRRTNDSIRRLIEEIQHMRGR